MAYINSADVTSFLNLTNLSANATAALTAIIAGVESAAEEHCNRTWSASAQQTETFDGGTDVFFPSKTPVTTITSITIDGDTVDSEDIYNYGSHIKLASKAASGHRNVVITYIPTEALPAAVKLALIQWAAQLFKAAEDGGKITERARVGEVEMWFKTQDGMPKSVKEVLDRHRVIPV